MTSVCCALNYNYPHTYWQFRVANQPNVSVFELWKENRRTWKEPTHTPYRKPKVLESKLLPLAVRQQSNGPSAPHL